MNVEKTYYCEDVGEVRSVEATAVREITYYVEEELGAIATKTETEAEMVPPREVTYYVEEDLGGVTAEAEVAPAREITYFTEEDAASTIPKSVPLLPSTDKKAKPIPSRHLTIVKPPESEQDLVPEEQAEAADKPRIPKRKTVPVSADITQSFDRPVVTVEAQSRIKHVGMIIDDIRDNIKYDRPPAAVEYEGPDAAQLLGRLLPKKLERAIRRTGSCYEDGHVYKRYEHAGKEGTDTYHPHFFFIDNTYQGKTRMYFVDPEHKVAKNNIIRPPIANLVGIEVPDNEDESPKVVILRYRTEDYDHEDKPVGLDHKSLFLVIEEALERDGQLPDALTGDMENRVLFAISATREHSRVQARYSTKKQMKSYARGGEGSSALEGKAKVQLDVANRLVSVFNKRSKARMVA